MFSITRPILMDPAVRRSQMGIFNYVFAGFEPRLKLSLKRWFNY